MSVFLANNDRYARWASWLYWLLPVPAALGTLLTGSRMGVITLVVALLAGLVISWSKSMRMAFLVFLIAACLAAIVPEAIPAALIERVGEGTESEGFQLRQEQWATGLEVWSEVPLTGVGVGAFQSAVGRAGGHDIVAHNTFIQVLVENGIVGLVMMILLWGVLVWYVWRLHGQARLLWLGIFAVWVVGSTVLSLESFKITWVIYAWIIAASPLGQRASSLESTGPVHTGVILARPKS
ncbi:MAG: O-antigen ligase family protein [Actinomycetia bacterium]|nr:O-antigen ligase family protein [Actinomycetes bacterium]